MWVLNNSLYFEILRSTWLAVASDSSAVSRVCDVSGTMMSNLCDLPLAYGINVVPYGHFLLLNSQTRPLRAGIYIHLHYLYPLAQNQRLKN